MSSIAETIIKKCGGVANVAAIVGCSENWVYRWKMAKDAGGTGGRVPAKAQAAIMEAAKQGKCKVKPSDFFEGAA